ncbi:LysR family transcriptional regulator [Apilactobacillus micheneri]|uniref:LysR family transcriptional regulator n=1 Tax=Apilactobacillus micheneri TaxID=1899430 RepID=A0ABY2Z1U4_9LACO|nr:LysR family transcriptional regulator [Apilactobacillus micheneri]TPR24671.1 LysR family transcriptional regulator [Apilactobacillus micheneri]TPR25982.1 LysR family transcriptional regulator [Apilactobacillus micheneri]TPR28172.1 LysR family transcriptional regulator [Apilactobacillus micheneri]TPR29663.1 LysR family transcriptional regulator [Apilactobacillus micheneri]TPR30449.1 LysR family transcriptional regulator [Apilactobacillus micheneri]
MLDQRYITFQILSKTKSYTKTAEKLFITQPAVTQQIKSLENELNLKLVNYQQPLLQITKDGQKLAEFINNINVQSNKFIHQLKETPKKRKLVFGSTRSVAIFMTPNIIKKLENQFHNIECVVTNTNEILKMIDNGKLDFAILEGNFNKQKYSYHVIKDEQFICVAGIDNPLASNKTFKIQELLKQNLLLREMGSGTRFIFANWLESLNITENDFNKVINVNEPTVINNLLQNNLGISFMYKSLAEKEINAGHLKEIKIKGLDIVRPINLVALKNNYFNELVNLIE